MLGKCVYHIFVAACLLLGFVQATVLVADPKDVTVDTNRWAQFICTVHCSYSRSVGWYMAGHRHAIRDNSSVPGLLIKRPPPSKCTKSNEWIHFFEVYAIKALNKSAFYCAAYEKHRLEKTCRCGTDGRCYSRPALLTVRMAATVNNPPTQASVTQAPTPSNCSASDPTVSSPEGRLSTLAASKQPVAQP